MLIAVMEHLSIAMGSIDIANAMRHSMDRIVIMVMDTISPGCVEGNRGMECVGVEVVWGCGGLLRTWGYVYALCSSVTAQPFHKEACSGKGRITKKHNSGIATLPADMD
ncbi:MAG TPA: hypothetical protein EYP10_03970, partial [Armatimonadetes bacterium]|nr:hypothetical protein [Armatimonadota bacterium]